MLKNKLPIAVAVGVLSVGLFSAPASALPSLVGNASDLNESTVEPPKKTKTPKETAPKKSTPKKSTPKKSVPKKTKSSRKLPPQPSYLDKDQIENARIIIGVGRAYKVPDRGIQIALMTAFQESDMYNLDHGDKDSKGLFQQRPKYGWGTDDQVQTRTFASQSFYGVNPKVKNAGLLDIKGWQKMSRNDAAQAVQRSGYPYRYAQWEKLAWQTLQANYDAPKIYHRGPIN